MMKKLISIIMVVSMLFSFSLVASAAEYALAWTNIDNVSGGDIVFSGTSGNYFAHIEGEEDVEKIVATVTLYYWNTRGNRWVELYTDWWYVVESNYLIIDENFTGTSGREYKAVLEVTVTMDGYDEFYTQTSTVTCP